MTCWLCGFETTELVTNANIPACKNGPCQICIEVANIDEEINHAVAALQRLVTKRCDLRSQQNRAHDPMHRLPVELKNYIFELVLPTQDEWDNIIQPRNTVMPSCLTSICRSWRDIAWSNPLLWSTIRIVVGRVSISGPSSRIDFVRDWIMRSRTLPLTFYIVAHSTEGVEEELKGVFDAISQCSNRWDSISLNTPFGLLRDFHCSDFQCHRLRVLRIITGQFRWEGDIGQHMPLFNSQVNPEEVEIDGLSFRSLQISWNRLSAAKVTSFNFEEIAQLFQHAPQMTSCHIFHPRRARNFSMPHIIHQSLKALTLCGVSDPDVAAMLLVSFTLSHLQELRIDEMVLLAPAYLPALVHRSSCPLTRITFFGDNINILPEHFNWHDLQPLPGVTDLVLESVDRRYVVDFRLLEGYFPDLRHLTLRLEPFLTLWNVGIISRLLDRKQLQPNAPNEGGLCKILVIDQAAEFHDMWNSDVRKQLKTLNISLREDGFEFL